MMNILKNPHCVIKKQIWHKIFLSKLVMNELFWKNFTNQNIEIRSLSNSTTSTAFNCRYCEQQKQLWQQQLCQHQQCFLTWSAVALEFAVNYACFLFTTPVVSSDAAIFVVISDFFWLVWDVQLAPNRKEAIGQVFWSRQTVIVLHNKKKYKDQVQTLWYDT